MTPKTDAAGASQYSFRVVGYSTCNTVTGELHTRYRVQERVRSWWTLGFGWTWRTVTREGGFPGYRFPREFYSIDSALRAVEQIRQERGWLPVKETVVVEL